MFNALSLTPELANSTVPLRLLAKLQKVKQRSEMLLRTNQVADRLFFVEKGFVVLQVHANGQLFVRHIAKPYEFITSLESFTTRQPSQESLRVVKGSTIYYINYQRLTELMQNDSEVDGYFRKIMQNSLIRCQERITDLLSLDAEKYYEKLLRDNKEILQAVPQYELASYLGIRPQSLSRIRKNISHFS